jgi:hypothetical protein
MKIQLNFQKNCDKISKKTTKTEKNMRIVVDRIDKNQNGEKIVALEIDDKIVFLDKNDFPEGVIDTLSSGNILEAEYENGKILKVEILKDKEEEKRNEMKSRLFALKNKNKK